MPPRRQCLRCLLAACAFARPSRRYYQSRRPGAVFAACGVALAMSVSWAGGAFSLHGRAAAQEQENRQGRST
eukprot:COSAG06_NODE_3774_length_4919_cov_10.651660_5_plen_72_part_00